MPEAVDRRHGAGRMQASSASIPSKCQRGTRSAREDLTGGPFKQGFGRTGRQGQDPRLSDLRSGQRLLARRSGQSGKTRQSAHRPGRNGHRAGQRGSRARPVGTAHPRGSRRCRGRRGSGRRAHHLGHSSPRAAQAERRSGADVPDADGGDSAADPGAGNRAGQEDRSHAQAVPPHGAGLQLHHAGHDSHAARSAPRHAAVRSHDQGLADRAADQRADHGPHAAQPADARAPARAESRGFQKADSQEHRSGRGGGGAQAFLPRPAQEPDAGRRAQPADAPRAAAGAAAQGDVAPHGCPAGAAGRFTARFARQGRAGQPAQGAARPDAPDAGKPQQLAQPLCHDRAAVL